MSFYDNQYLCLLINNTQRKDRSKKQEVESLDSKTTACHTEPLGEVSKTLESKKDNSCLHTRNDKNLDSTHNTPAHTTWNLDSNKYAANTKQNLDSNSTQKDTTHSTQSQRNNNTKKKKPMNTHFQIKSQKMSYLAR